MAHEGLILPHPRRPNDARWRLLADFRTGRAELRPKHVSWLSQVAVPQVRAGQWVFLRGFASRLGDATHTNQPLSEARVGNVRDFLLRAGVPPVKITGTAAVGESWSDGPENDNSPQWRAVEVILTNEVVQLPPERMTAEHPLSRRFFVKYCGSGGGGLGRVGLELNLFLIRNPSNYFQRYFLPALTHGVGLPISFGEPVAPPRGWVEFSTLTFRTVDSFVGPANVVSAGGQIGPVGPSVFGLEFRQMGVPHPRRTLWLPTGRGLQVGFGGSAGTMTTAGDVEHSRRWQWE